MSVKQVWVSPSDSGWKVQSANSDRASAVIDNKAEAIERARGIAINQGAELIVQNLDGKIGYKNSYGNDSFPPRG